MITKYKDEECGLSLHADDEEEIDVENPIISLSLGASRPMIFQNKANKNRLTSATLHHGDIMLMSGHSQKRYKHCIPECAEKLESRISITFRCIKLNRSDGANIRRFSQRQTRPRTYSAAISNNDRSTSATTNNTEKRCLILHDSIYNQVDQHSLSGFETKLRSIKTLEEVSKSNTRKYLKKDNLLKEADIIVFHLGVNDLKHVPTYTVVEDLKAALLNLAQSSPEETKIFFSLVLPVGDPALNNRINDFNSEAIRLITDLRKRSYLKFRLYTVFNTEFTEKHYDEIENLYSDSIHINAEGRSKLLNHLNRVLRCVTARGPSSIQTPLRPRTI